jgi:cytochrome b pre-mRNA-processing protein 6
VLAKRLAKGPLAPAAKGATQEQADLKQANALYSLLEDRFKNKVGFYGNWQAMRVQCTADCMFSTALLLRPSNPRATRPTTKTC